MAIPNIPHDFCCYAFSKAALELALTLRRLSIGCQPVCAFIYAPKRIAANIPSVESFTRLSEALATSWQSRKAHLFIGSCGIATRAIAPFIQHKSIDPPVLVMDSGGRFCISLLSGHLGGANSLCEKLAQLTGATPVITTASDAAGLPSLDMMFQTANLAVLDWEELPGLQGRLLEGEKLGVFDPFCYLLPKPGLYPVCSDRQGEADILITWLRLPSRSGAARISPVQVCVGMGYRRDVSVDELESGFYEALGKANLERASIALCATVAEKLSAVRELASRLSLGWAGFDASSLAQIKTPDASSACGARFAQPPFSVCEAAAIAGAATLPGPKQMASTLINGKIKIDHKMTFAFAAKMPEK